MTNKRKPRPAAKKPAAKKLSINPNVAATTVAAAIATSVAAIFTFNVFHQNNKKTQNNIHRRTSVGSDRGPSQESNYNEFIKNRLVMFLKNTDADIRVITALLKITPKKVLVDLIVMVDNMNNSPTPYLKQILDATSKDTMVDMFIAYRNAYINDIQT
jgi:hypothetical protein